MSSVENERKVVQEEATPQLNCSILSVSSAWTRTHTRTAPNRCVCCRCVGEEDDNDERMLERADYHKLGVPSILLVQYARCTRDFVIMERQLGTNSLILCHILSWAGEIIEICQTVGFYLIRYYFAFAGWLARWLAP